jgi:DNA topoisomerase IB
MLSYRRQKAPTSLLHRSLSVFSFSLAFYISFDTFRRKKSKEEKRRDQDDGKKKISAHVVCLFEKKAQKRSNEFRLVVIVMG